MPQIFGCLCLLPICDALAYYYSTKAVVQPPFLPKQALVGLWKISQRCHFPYPNPSELYKDSIGNNVGGGRDGMLLCLHQDGTFTKFVEDTDGMDASDVVSESDLELMLGRGGCWTFHQDQHLLLASKQPKDVEDETMQDLLFRGRVTVPPTAHSETSDPLLNSANLFVNNDERDIPELMHPFDDDYQLPTIPHGILSTGKFANDHDAFFEEPVFMGKSLNIGSFAMHQLASNRMSKSDHSNNKALPKFTLDTLLHHTFYLATAPHRTEKSDIAMMDVRVLQMRFYSNHTFVAMGTEKNLRGTYGWIQDEGEPEQLWFQVSLYGNGRHVPGSVFSEGRLLTQEDRRGYIGTIQSQLHDDESQRYSVYGTYFAGFDVLQAHRSNAESLGTFLLQEIEGDPENDEDGNSNKGDDQKATVGDPGFGAEDDLADLYAMGFDFLGDSMDDYSGDYPYTETGEEHEGNYDNDAVDEYDGHNDDYGIEVDDYDYDADHLDAIEDYYDDAEYFDEMKDSDILDVDMDGSYADYPYKMDLDDLPFQ